MRLRENSPEPLKHFDDLQKIGLSERQASKLSIFTSCFL
jgi:hypothetical protein